MLLPLWVLYKIKHKGHRYKPLVSATEMDIEKALLNKQNNIQTILSQDDVKRFLEIGIGERPDKQRIELICERRIDYVGCDFKSVCDQHQKQLSGLGLNQQNISFAPNIVGSYSWSLFEMLQNQEVFDVIYLDGHHTFYVDLPALSIAHYLLKPGGYFIADDILWTLEFLKYHLTKHFGDWCFYRKIYNFSEYEHEQQKLPHIRLLVEQLLVKQLGYSKIERFSDPWWWVLQKPITML